MQEVNTEIYLKKKTFFSFHGIKSGNFYFGENGVIKNPFHKNKNPINY